MAQEQRTVRIGSGGTAVTSAPDLLSSDPDEMRLTFIEWLQAYKRYLALIAEYQPKNLLAWNQHHAIIFAHTLRDSHWALVLRYDIELRKCSCHSTIDVTIFQQNIFDDLREKSCDKAVHLTSHAPQAALPKSFRPYQPPNTTSSLPPYRKDHPTSYRTTNNFTTIPAVPNTLPPPPLHDHGKCFRCGFKGHGARRCLNETMPNSHPVIITKGAKNSWLLDGKPFCYKFNNPTRHMPVPCAAQRNTAPKPAAHDPRKVSCLLPHDIWESKLRALGLWEEFKDVPPGLRNGFDIGAAGLATETYIPENHKSAWDRPSVIQEHIDTEVAAGRYTGPFTQSTLHSLIGPFRTTPLGVTEKPSTPGKFWVIQDFSYPHDAVPSISLNAQIDTTRFTCQWGFFHDVAKAVALAPPGSKAATFDVDTAYRQMPIHTEDQPHTVVSWNGLFWVDHRVPFGAASSNGIFGWCGDAMARIYKLHGFGLIFKWVDDFLFIQTPHHRFSPSFSPPLFSEEAIYQLAARLGWPWKHAKTRLFAFIFTYLGFVWDLEHKQVSIPPEKRAKYSTHIRDWLARPKASLKEMEVIIGSLIHCALAIPDGCAHIAGLIAFCATLPREYKLHFRTLAPSQRAIADAHWWLKHLNQGDCSSFVRPPPPPTNLTIYTDASTSFSLGVIIDDQFMAWRLLHGWNTDD
ncbi:hypothetical protein FRC06_002607 [Ceratobasidium sp. 370]|nr:hypothetical protein FRC06_002607 [Ceratobasidium sp. 370]